MSPRENQSAHGCGAWLAESGGPRSEPPGRPESEAARDWKASKNLTALEIESLRLRRLQRCERPDDPLELAERRDRRLFLDVFLDVRPRVDAEENSDDIWDTGMPEQRVNPEDEAWPS